MAFLIASKPKKRWSKQSPTTPGPGLTRIALRSQLLYLNGKDLADNSIISNGCPPALKDRIAWMT
jgi:hypothetical protein